MSSLGDSSVKTPNELKINVLLLLSATYPNIAQNEKITTKIACDKYNTTSTIAEKYYKPISKILNKDEK